MDGVFHAVHPVGAGETGRLMESFEDRLAQWRKVRDTQVFAPADAGHLAQAYTAVHGPLAAVNELMAASLDKLYTAEVGQLKAAAGPRTAPLTRPASWSAGSSPPVSVSPCWQRGC
jgi:hypothetical protein